MSSEGGNAYQTLHKGSSTEISRNSNEGLGNPETLAPISTIAKGNGTEDS
jgi:hypothetical protein